MRRIRAFAGLAVVLAITLLPEAPGAAEPPPRGLSPGPDARVASVVDGDTVTLVEAVEGASEVRLVGLQAPKLPLGRPGFQAWPLADESRAALARLVEGQRVRLGFGGARRDRHGRLLAHLHAADGTWVQGAMLAAGMARVYTFADNRALGAEMLALEADARAARRGIWGQRFYAIRTPENVGRDIDTFQVVEGTVLEAATVRGRTYLNFGPDYRTDFTVSIDGGARRLFAGAGVDPLALQGQRIRVRGWVSLRNGPMIEATHPEQIERLP